MKMAVGGYAYAFSPSEVKINRALDKFVAWLDRWIVTRFLGAGGDASDW
jgi:hypothetical protein